MRSRVILDELRSIKSSAKEWRRFGWTVGLVFCLIGAWCFWRHKAAGPVLSTAGVFLIALGLAWPRGLKEIYIAWMSLAVVLGFIVSTILLTVFFYGVVTPVGIVARLSGKDFLNRKLDPAAPTYWIRRTDSGRPRERYAQQF